MFSLKLAMSKTKELNGIAFPLIVQNIATTAIVVADAAIVGRLSKQAFNAVGVVGALFSSLRHN